MTTSKKTKTIILFSGLSGSGKDYIANRLVEELGNKEVLAFAHADILKKYCSDMFNVELKYFHRADKDKLFVQFNRTNMFEEADVLTIKEIQEKIDSFVIWDDDKLNLFFLENEAKDLYSLGFPVFVSLRTLLLYFGYHIMKKKMPPFLLLYQSLREITETQEFKDCNYFIVKDNRFDEEFDFLIKFANKNKYKIKYVQIESNKANNLDNVAEGSISFPIEEYISLDDIMILDNSDQTEESTKKKIAELIDFI